MTKRFTPMDWLHKEALEEDFRREHCRERFQESITLVWNSPIPECYASGIIRFGHYAGLF